MQDFAQAYAFINALTNGQSDSAVIDWRAIHDQRQDVPAYPMRGTLAECWPALMQYNTAGYGIFCTVSAMDGNGRELVNVAHARAHFVDLDNLSAEQNYQRACNWQPAPWFAVMSSPGKYHLYWVVAPYADSVRFSHLQRKFRQFFDGDKRIVDATRVMRVPGTVHLKGEPYLVTCHALAGYGQPLTVEHLEAALSAVQVIDGGDGDRHPLGDPAMAAPSLDWIKRALDMTDPNSLDRGEWISLTASVKQSGWTLADGETLFAIWSDWCARYDTNNAGENRKTWDSIRNTEVGWPYLSRRVPQVHLAAVAPVQPVAVAAVAVGAPVAPVPPPPAPPPLDCSGEFLTDHEQRVWFKGCTAIERTGEILVPSGRFMKPAQFNIRYGGKRFLINTAGKDTDEAWKAATRSTLWTIPKADHVRFLPEYPFGEIIVDQLGRSGVNTYIPVQIKSRPGDVTPWLNHIAAMLPVESDRDILYRYLAHNIKFPGYKIPWAPMIQSTEGVGKGFVMEVLERIIGEMYCYSPKAQELVKSGSTFNAWMRAKLLIIVNEIKVDERRELIEILKPMITDKRVEIQAKGIDQEMEDNCANWIFFSNFKDAIPVDQNGRRYCIFYSAIQSKQDLLSRGMDDAYYTALFKWMRAGGDEFIADWLLRYPIERGDIPGKAPDTSSTAEALALSRGPIERLIADAVEDQLEGFRGGWVSVTMLIRLMAERKMRSVSQQVLEGILSKMGYYQAGRSPRAFLQEDAKSRSVLFATVQGADVTTYGRAQGWE